MNFIRVLNTGQEEPFFKPKLTWTFRRTSHSSRRWTSRLRRRVRFRRNGHLDRRGGVVPNSASDNYIDPVQSLTTQTPQSTPRTINVFFV